jgi:site-specific DNA-methyltransferase (adenine-specific)
MTKKEIDERYIEDEMGSTEEDREYFEERSKTKKYQIIYADPPWSYYNDSNAKPDCTTVKGMRRPPYSVMSSKAITELPVRNISAENCILFIWTTDYHLEKCLEVIGAWGFTYKTIGFVWNKKCCFMGAYTMKSGIELCLLATKGKDAHKLVKKHNIRSLIEEKRTEHSRKPYGIREKIVELLGDLPKIELFARQKVDGWDVWGNEVESDILL